MAFLDLTGLKPFTCFLDIYSFILRDVPGCCRMVNIVPSNMLFYSKVLNSLISLIF